MVSTPTTAPSQIPHDEAQQENSVSSLEGDETSPLQKVTLGLQKVTLGRVVAYFKYEATKQINALNGTPGKKVFQRNYHDHIIRDYIDRYFIEQYIELNPIMWELDRDNPASSLVPLDDLRARLEKEHELTGLALERIIEHEQNNREW